ncbi:hypothetical protein [Blautia glucerasea]|uniref:hypothetical protein n=1 Tax=Blautia glucerasea TaxID=536633 RepID=UPI001D06B056|nr:hypothetical protein [Blautia glucerasea]MCB6544467.1 hypothetical protein [Blautia glucerasea]
MVNQEKEQGGISVPALPYMVLAWFKKSAGISSHRKVTDVYTVYSAFSGVRDACSSLV